MNAPAKILSASEPWAEYQLEDGTLLRFRLTACNFRKTGKQTEQGDPEYSFSQQVQCETHAAPKAASVSQLHAEWARPGLVSIAPSGYIAPAEDVG